MKVFLFLVLLLSSPTLFSQEQDVRMIEVSGTATAKGEVDRVTWRISLRGMGESLEAAGKELEAISASMKEGLAPLDLPEGALRMSRVRSGREYDRKKDGTRTFIGFYAERGGLVQTGKLTLTEAIEAALLKNDGIEIAEMELNSSKITDLKREAGIEAVEAAKEKAQTMAGVLGAELGEILIIREGDNSHRFVVTENRISMPIFDGAREPTAFEEISVKASVTLRFELK